MATTEGKTEATETKSTEQNSAEKSDHRIKLESWQGKSIEDYEKFVDALAEKSNLKPEQLRKQLKVGDFTGLNLNEKTGNVIVHEDLLKDQTELLFNLFTRHNNPSDTSTKELAGKIELKTLEKLLADAAFKNRDTDDYTIMHQLAFPAPNSDAIRALNKGRLLTLIENATPKELEQRNKDGDTALNLMLRFYPHEKPENISKVSTEERQIIADNAEVIKTYASKMEIESLNTHLQDPYIRERIYKTIEDEINKHTLSGEKPKDEAKSESKLFKDRCPKEQLPDKKPTTYRQIHKWTQQQKSMGL